MEIDTLLVLVGLVLAMNAPFYIMSLQSYRTIAWIRANCPACIGSGFNGGNN
jgi:hypothetical protein